MELISKWPFVVYDVHILIFPLALLGPLLPFGFFFESTLESRAFYRFFFFE